MMNIIILIVPSHHIIGLITITQGALETVWGGEVAVGCSAPGGTPQVSSSHHQCHWSGLQYKMTIMLDVTAMTNNVDIDGYGHGDDDDVSRLWW